VRISLVDAEIPVIVLIGSLKIKIINIETKAGKKITESTPFSLHRLYTYAIRYIYMLRRIEYVTLTR